MAIQLPFRDASSWRVTPQNPVRFQNGFDFERCAGLHNQLTEIGWVGSGKPLDDLPRTTYLDADALDKSTEDWRSRIPDDLVAFYERALVVGGNHSFFYYVDGLLNSGDLWSMTKCDNIDHDDESRFLTLYLANPMASHLRGIIRPKGKLGYITDDNFDTHWTKNGRQQWYPLEVILSAWLDMVDAGKIQAVGPEVKLINNKYEPWIIHPWSESQLQETVKAFDLLVDSIESRMPHFESLTKEPLLSDETLDVAHLPNGFARAFLSQAERPRFKDIAPGLSVPGSLSFPSQPFFPDYLEAPPEDGEERGINVTLLFGSSDFFITPQDYDDKTGSGLPFGWPYHRVRSYPAGLYITSTDRGFADFEDGVRLVLPFGIGSNGFARTSDGERFGESYDANLKDTHSELYQPGYQAFVAFHEVRLVKILESWTDMIERGDWEVGPEGVEGTIDAFKEADTSEGWSKFVVPVSW